MLRALLGESVDEEALTCMKAKTQRPEGTKRKKETKKEKHIDTKRNHKDTYDSEQPAKTIAANRCPEYRVLIAYTAQPTNIAHSTQHAAKDRQRKLTQHNTTQDVPLVGTFTRNGVRVRGGVTTS